MEEKERESLGRTGTLIAGLSAGGALFVGVLGLFGGFSFGADGGLYLIAAAIAFGLLANAAFRD